MQTLAGAPSEDVDVPPPPSELPVRFGDWCVAMGLATAAQVQECLRWQEILCVEGRPHRKLGQLLAARGYLAAAQVAQVLARQRREIRICHRCGLRVNVDLRPDVIRYACGRCRGRLLEAPDPENLEVATAPVILESREPVPAEVCEASRRPENLFGRFILLGPLGRGGVGQISLAWDPMLSSRVALKCLRRDLRAGDPMGRRDACASLFREARCAPFIRHPGIVRILELGWAGDDLFLSMDFVEGRPLDEEARIARARGSPSLYHRSPHRALSILSAVARSLHHAHTAVRPVVHCDLKPGNILVDPEGRPRLIDFGFARVLDGRPAEASGVCGTPNYMAPEQVRGSVADIDERTDVYGLGAILYELLTGRPPFTGDPLTVLYEAATKPPPSPLDVLRRLEPSGDGAAGARAGIPPALVDLAMACLQKDKERRPGSALTVAQAVEESLRTAPRARAS